MPRFDGTGPLGMGSGSGRGRGICGSGRRYTGYCRYFGSPISEDDAMKRRKEYLENELEVIKRHLNSNKKND